MTTKPCPVRMHLPSVEDPAHCVWCGADVLSLSQLPISAPASADDLTALVELIRSGHEVHLGPSNVPGKLLGEIYVAAIPGAVIVSARCVMAEGDSLGEVAAELLRQWEHPKPSVVATGEAGNIVSAKGPHLNSLGFTPERGK